MANTMEGIREIIAFYRLFHRREQSKRASKTRSDGHYSCQSTSFASRGIAVFGRVFHERIALCCAHSLPSDPKMDSLFLQELASK